MFTGDTLFIDSPANSLFNLRSMDVADLGASTGKTVFTYSYSSLTGSGSRTVEAQDASGVSRIQLDLDALVFFMLTVNSIDGIQIDNVDVRPAIPEPASWAMLLAGACVIGAAALRRRGEPTAQR